MLVIVAHRQQAAMDNGMQRLDAAVHHLRKAGDLRNILHGEARVAQRLGRAAGRDQLDAALRQRRREFDNTRFVGHRKQRPTNDHIRHNIP